MVLRLSEPPTDALPMYRVDPDRYLGRIIIYDSDGGLTTPLVSVKPTQPSTSEPCPVCLVLPGVFTVTRTGAIDRALTVFFTVSGSAQNGIDYERISGPVTVPSGKASVEIPVLAKLDELAEPIESVVLELVMSPTAGPIDPYLIDPYASAAKIAIHDRADRPGKAFVAIVAPKSGERVILPAKVPLVATTVDSMGAMTRLEWFAQGEKIGTSEVFFIRPPDPGMPITHELYWAPSKPGSYKLTAVGADSTGVKVESESVLLEVVEGGSVDPVKQVVVEVVQSDGLAMETGADGKPDAGVLKVRRVAGPTDIEVRVNYEVTGSATPGVDYVALAGHEGHLVGISDRRVGPPSRSRPGSGLVPSTGIAPAPATLGIERSPPVDNTPTAACNAHAYVATVPPTAAQARPAGLPRWRHHRRRQTP
ncbi:MAG: hypothetical protein FJ404_18020, partial [Verrucomicrobia bacterium]|nr:hypothetical protein [Verrucomicrobiota bacterium]